VIKKVNKRLQELLEKSKTENGATESTLVKPIRRKCCREKGVEIRVPRGSPPLLTRIPSLDLTELIVVPSKQV